MCAHGAASRAAAPTAATSRSCECRALLPTMAPWCASVGWAFRPPLAAAAACCACVCSPGPPLPVAAAAPLPHACALPLLRPRGCSDLSCNSCAVKLRGTIYPELAFLDELLDLNLAGNELGGGLPPLWGANATFLKLVELNLNDNQLTGPVSAPGCGVDGACSGAGAGWACGWGVVRCFECMRGLPACFCGGARRSPLRGGWSRPSMRCSTCNSPTTG